MHSNTQKPIPVLMKEEILAKKKKEKNFRAEWGDESTSKKHTMIENLQRQVLKYHPQNKIHFFFFVGTGLTWIYIHFKCI